MAVAAGWQWWINRPAPLEFEEIDGLPGWRMVSFEGLTSGGAAGAVFAGIGADPVDLLAPERLCPVIFRDAGEGVVPLAMFTDAFCPYCRVMEPRMHTRSQTVAFLDLPLLGPASEVAARANIAAEMQGSRSFRQQMMTRPFRPTRAAISALAGESGVSLPRLLADMESDAVTARLAEIRAAAATLGIIGTPALAVGQTVAMGNVENDTIARLIEDESARPGAGC